MSQDGWSEDEPYTLDTLLEKYVELDADCSSRPITRPLSYEPATTQLPARIHHLHRDSDDSDSDGEFVTRPRFFTPPLQYQRNSFVRDTLNEYENIKKLAVLGCGELSLERTLLHEFSRLGVGRVVSVDIDEQALAKGIHLMKGALKRVENTVKGALSDPVLLEYYSGSILEFDNVLRDVDCVCSTEVIEHIPLEQAEIFLRLVLSTTQPRLAILSTPNHEYNVAFGSKQGEFRHDDHKYEFTRAEFKDWLARIVADYDAYDYRIEYVGNVQGYTHLSGATQFVVLWRKDGLGEERDAVVSSADPYVKVGESVVQHGVYGLMREKVRVSMRSWVEGHLFDESTIVKNDYAQFWRVFIEDIVSAMELPPVLRQTVDTRNIMEILRFLCRMRIFEDCVHDIPPHLVIPNTVTKRELLSYLQ